MELKHITINVFMDLDNNIIVYRGHNYYKACGERVFTDYDTDTQSTCIKRVGHPHRAHEDYDGRTREGWFCPHCDMHNHLIITECLGCGLPIPAKVVPE